MAAPVELVPLNCTRCGTPVPAAPGEIAWACRECGRGLHLHEEEGLLPLEIQYHQGVRPGETGSPFWVAEGRVEVARDTYGWGSKDGEARDFWEQPRWFFIPAFTCEVDQLVSLGTMYLRRPRALDPGPPVPFLPVTLSAEDVPPYAQFLVVAIEAERKDNIKEIDFKLMLGPRELWILP